MADVTINYEGSAIATMSASGTKTLLTEGKYCTDDIEVVYVSPGGGGGSMLSAQVTFAQDALTVTLNDFANTALEHFFLTVDGPIQNAALGSSVRRFGAGYICFTSGKENYFTIATNGNGDNMNAIAKASTAGSSAFTFDRTTGILTLQYAANYGYLAGGVTYDFYMW